MPFSNEAKHAKKPLTSGVAAPVITRQNLMLQALQLKVQFSLQTFLLPLWIDSLPSSMLEHKH